MSYCRFGWDGSDVYIFKDFDNILECCMCKLTYELNPDYQKFTETEEFGNMTPWQLIFGSESPSVMRRIEGRENRFSKTDQMLEHIAEHRRADHHVPTYVDERLRQEASNEGGK